VPPPGYALQYVPPPGYAMVAAVPVVVRGETEPLIVEFYHPKAKPQVDPPIARCPVPCRAVLPAGKYKLYVHEGEGTVAGSRVIDVTQPTTLTVGPKSSAQRTGGLILGLAGSGMLLGGIIVASANACFDGSYNCGTDSEEAAAVALLLGGLVATPIGWIMFANSFSARVTQTAPQYGLAPTLFPSRGSGSNEQVPGLVFNGRF
jgi:hypothetical protein